MGLNVKSMNFYQEAGRAIQLIDWIDLYVSIRLYNLQLFTVLWKSVLYGDILRYVETILDFAFKLILKDAYSGPKINMQ
jgi:hypothetical protein